MLLIPSCVAGSVNSLGVVRELTDTSALMVTV